MFAWAERSLPAGTDTSAASPSLGYLLLRLIQQFAVFSVPAFLFVSGVFVLFATPRNRSAPGWNVIGGRVVWLLIPYLVWTGIGWVGFWLLGKTVPPGGYARMLLTGSTNPAYYYVPVLVQLYLLSPLLIRWGKAHWPSLVAATALLQGSVVTVPYLVGLGLPMAQSLGSRILVPKWLFVGYVFWFALGIVLAERLPRWRDNLRRWRWGLLAASVVLLGIGVTTVEWMQAHSGTTWPDHPTNLVDMAYTAAVLLAFVGFAEAGMRRSPPLETLGARSYGIYLVHPWAMEVFARGVYHFVPRLLAFPLLFAGAVAGIGLAIPLALMAITRRSPLRPAYRHLYG